ncbi:type II toxin-antitoxin system VapC family toxin [Gracilimonas mengyeensis]|uniref:Predicted nucleic acid-binding protein, contains PIN domain n=1 Tax=Gracilimonas mengyeensis TaxID=1302730 RepID=A0A521E3J6_9BACT|nr:type II toxin-antitoxin system VapC family toxin [Gracilimonas mengyeensis]SMO78509.1 Predicted nucleic acid-binding protein, contains PIN domain [Gracilimonas mengyeensis]
MKIPVIDACFAVKWFLPEDGSENARRFFSGLDNFVVPDLFLIEIDNILSKKVRRKELDISGAEKIFSIIRNLPFITVPYEKLSKEVFFISTRFPVTQYDACYLALAVEYDGRFYTADKRFLRGVENTAYSEFVIGLDEL